MNTLIAESGSTNTSWRLINASGQISQFKTTGINPYYEEEGEIAQKLASELLPLLENTSVDAVYFYGSGCGQAKQSAKVSNAIRTVLKTSKISVENDLLAAAKAQCSTEAGIVCILGTGTNACLYDGAKIIAQPISLGFILGDEGSGGFLGKMLIKRWLEDELPAPLAEKFNAQFQLSKAEVIEQVYQQQYPNRYLAGFSVFLSENQSEPYLYRLVYDAFSLFIEKFIMKLPNYTDYKIHFVGSIAFHFNNILRKALADKKLTIGHIAENAIAGLALHHTKH